MSRELSRKLRNNATEPEQAMWRLLKTFRAEGLNFRRQVQVGAYVVDFACFQPAMVIEVDGDSHATDLAQSNDAIRDDYLAGAGSVSCASVTMTS